MRFLAATDENYRPPAKNGFYWVVPNDSGKPEPAEWDTGMFFLIGEGIGWDYSDLNGYWTTPITRPAKPTTGE